MKTLPFVKMEGAGNDYIFVDACASPLPIEKCPELAVRLSDRHGGIGADGLIVLDRSERADCRMLMWNSDGSRGAMCGNGIRCVAKLAYERGYGGQTMTIESDVGIHAAELVLDADDQVMAARIDMGEVSVEATPVQVDIAGAQWSYHSGSAGNPHAVVFCGESLDQIDVAEVGAAFQRHPAFPDGVNVEFVRVVADELEQRTYERGSGETLACGTGATVAALAAMVTGRIDRPEIVVVLRGGRLKISRDDSRLVLEGSARTVFTGEVSIP